GWQVGVVGPPRNRFPVPAQNRIQLHREATPGLQGPQTLWETSLGRAARPPVATLPPSGAALPCLVPPRQLPPARPLQAGAPIPWRRRRARPSDSPLHPGPVPRRPPHAAASRRRRHPPRAGNANDGEIRIQDTWTGSRQGATAVAAPAEHDGLPG